MRLHQYRLLHFSFSSICAVRFIRPDAVQSMHNCVSLLRIKTFSNTY